MNRISLQHWLRGREVTHSLLSEYQWDPYRFDALANLTKLMKKRCSMNCLITSVEYEETHDS